MILDGAVILCTVDMFDLAECYVHSLIHEDCYVSDTKAWFFAPTSVVASRFRMQFEAPHANNECACGISHGPLSTKKCSTGKYLINFHSRGQITIINP